MKWLKLIQGFLLSLIFLMVFGSITYSSQYFVSVLANSQNKNSFLASISENVISNKPDDKNVLKAQLPELDIAAESAIAVESDLAAADKILFEKSGSKKLPIASLTKLMTAMVVLDNYDPLQKITVSKTADLQDPMKQDVKLGDTLSVESFLNIMLVGSSNKAAYTLAELIGEQKFVNLMNKKAQDLGLENTFFADPTGLNPQNVSTARDLTKLAEYILKNYPKIADISRAEESFIINFGMVTNTNQLLGEVPEIVCGKTGFTTQAKGCLLLVTNNPKNNNYLINVILGSDDRFLEMKKLIDWQNIVCE